jgi:hypothetical protein
MVASTFCGCAGSSRHHTSAVSPRVSVVRATGHIGVVGVDMEVSDGPN